VADRTRRRGTWFVTFLTELKSAGLPVSLREYLTLMEALEADLAERRVEDFYHLARVCLVKDEKFLDKFDQVFNKVFKGILTNYGQTPVDPDRNPDRLSITELEFNEAVRLGRPRLLFIMGDDHGVKAAHVETDASKIAKRDAFKERAKAMCPASGGQQRQLRL